MSRRTLLKGLTLSQASVIVGLPPLVSMFNAAGTAYAAERTPADMQGGAIKKRFVLWFNGNGIAERYWIPSQTGPNYDISPCLLPIGKLKDDVLVLSGLDNTVLGGKTGSGHEGAMSALMTGMPFSGRGGGGRSFDQLIADKLSDKSRFRSLQIGVSQESFGGSIQKNMSWSGLNRPLPPEELPHRLFDRLFGARDHGWINRKRSILDAVQQDANLLSKGLPKEDQQRLDEHLSSIRDLERSVASLPPNYMKVTAPEEEFDLKDWPRVAKLQSDLLANALATGQTQVASYMLTKCQGLARFPWLGLTAARHHDYTHKDGKAPGENGEEGQRILRDINRWHVEEFAYLVAKLKSIPEGDGNLLDNTLLIYVHEHAEAGPHKAIGHVNLVAGCRKQVAHGQHLRLTGTIGDMYLTLADGVLGAGLGRWPAANGKIPQLLA
jgi:Protein of unknown function (DUF1552)